MHLLHINNIRFGYNAIPVLRDIAFTVKKGEIVGIIGPNGSGKTTLLKIIDGLITPQAGEVLVAGQDIRNIKRKEVASVIAFVPQELSLIFPFSVREVVMMGRYPHLDDLHFEGSRDHLIVREAMELTDTLSLADRMMHHISGGERQRVLVARALAQKPQIMLLDEATAFLDIRHQITLFELINRLHETQGLTVLMVTHDINLAARYTDRIILLKEGTMRSMGTPDMVITEDTIREVYETDVLVDKHPRTGAPRVTLA